MSLVDHKPPELEHNFIPAMLGIPQLNPRFFYSLTPEERFVLPYMWDLWLRPEQRVSPRAWSYHGWICGRGWGKSLTIAREINRRVMAGEARSLGFMAPTEGRAEEVQISFIINTAPPWFKPVRYRGGVLWPNGVQALTFTPEAPGRSRSENLDLAWLCEIVDWSPTTQKEAFDNITTATRVGRAQVLWDTTSKGKNEVIQHLLELHEEDPLAYPVQRGTTYDNPLLKAAYLRREFLKYSGRRYDEEILGLSFAEAEGALWEQEWLNRTRVQTRPTHPDVRIVSVDPALSDHKTADIVGISVGSRVRLNKRETWDGVPIHDEDVFLEEDLSERLKPEQWGDIVVDQCIENGCSGVLIERNRLGDNAEFVVKACARNKNQKVRVLKPDDPFPRYLPGVIYIKTVNATSGKTSRAGGPSAETKAGRVHVVGKLSELEFEFTTYEEGTAKSPNRYDAAVHLVNELRGLAQDDNSAREDTETARAIYNELQAQTRFMGVNRRVGL